MADQAVSSQTLDTIPKRVQFLAENYPDRDLFVFYQGENRDPYTSQQLFQLAGKFANRLRHQYGFKRNDIIANTLPNSPERVVTDLGIALAGCACMNGQILLADGADFFQSARNSKCSGVILRAEDGSPAWRLLKPYVTGNTSSGIVELSCNQAPDLTSAILVSRRTDRPYKPLLDDLKGNNEEVFVDSIVSPDDLLYIFTTSGSTGYSKLVPRTNAEIVAIGSGFVLDNDAEPKDDYILYSDRLLGWPGGYPFSTFCHGQKRVSQDFFESHGQKSGESTWKAIRTEKCSTSFIFPLELDSILRYVSSIGGADYKLKMLGSGAQPLKKSQIASMFTIAEAVNVFYASTEASPLSVGFITTADTDDFFCGKPPAGVTLKIIDEHGDECKPRQTGTILAKTPTMFKGYYNRLQDPDPNTAKCFTKDGWFDTEDIGYLDEAGNVYVMGRNKDTIIYGSSVLYPGWLEAKIMQHPEIAEARILPKSEYGFLRGGEPPVYATLVGFGEWIHLSVPVLEQDQRHYMMNNKDFQPKFTAGMVSDPVLFHNICACVKPISGSDLNEERLKKYCETIFISDLENALTPMPKYFMVLDSFPETATGKPDKNVLTQMAEERFGRGCTNE